MQIFKILEARQQDDGEEEDEPAQKKKKAQRGTGSWSTRVENARRQKPKKPFGEKRVNVAMVSISCIVLRDSFG